MLRSSIHQRLRFVAASAVLIGCVVKPVFAQDPPPGRAVAGVAQVQARVIGIDPVTNSVTLQGPSGRAVEVAVNPQVGDVSKLKLGDTVNIEYRNALLMRVAKAKSNGIRERIETEAMIPASGGVMAEARTVEVLATIQRIDAKTRQITLRGPQRTVTLDVAPDVSLAGLKTGDMVHAQFESATAVQVMRDGQPVK